MATIERSTTKPSTPERVIITGATSGLGLDIARRFLAEGAQVVIHGRDPQKLARVRETLGAAPGRLVAVAGDVGEPGTAQRLADAARTSFGGADVLVNSAGIFLVKPFLDTTPAEIDALYQTNVKGSLLVIQAVVPLMIEAGGASSTSAR